jgi:adenylosuccinate synthase
MINSVDFVVGLSNGDEGKGAVAHSLASRPEYNLVMRVAGGMNAGHTIYHNGKKIVTHIIPCGVLHGKTSLIGSGCVLNERKFHEEIEGLAAQGFDTSVIKIARNAHIITEKHLKEEQNETKIGTTKQGNGPAYRDKYDRKGVRAEKVKSLEPHLVDVFDFLHSKDVKWNVLVEGAQGFNLDIDHGNYPYVTSSHTTTAGGFLNMLSARKLNKVYGCLKAYDTYVGSEKFQPEGDIFNEIAELGSEFGSTTGRKRQVNWLNLDAAIKASVVNEVSHFIVSKLDILRELNKKYGSIYWKVIHNDQILSFESETVFKDYIASVLGYTQFRESPAEPVAS